MWQFERINRIDYQELSDKWEALVTLSNDGVEESFFLKYNDVPKKKDILEAAEKLVENKNLQLEQENRLETEQNKETK